MLRRAVLGLLILSAFVSVPSAYAGKVELRTYYPAPNGDYRNFESLNSLTLPKKSADDEHTTPQPAAGEIWVNATT